MLPKGGLMKLIISLTIASIAAFACSDAYGAPASCLISSSPGMNFGSYSVATPTSLDSTGGITISCDKNTQAIVAIGQSPNSGGFDPRQMKLTTGSDLLSYNLFTTSARTVIWGDGTGTTETVREHAFSGIPLTLTIYGRIPAGQDVSAGFYSENLTVIVTP